MNRCTFNFLLLLLFFISVRTFFSQSETEKVLKQNITKSKNSDQKIISLDELSSYYSNVNLKKREQTISQLKKKLLDNIEKKSFDIINLNLAEELLREGNIPDFLSFFNKHFNEKEFKDDELKHRLNSIRFQFDYYQGNTDYLSKLRNDLNQTKRSRKYKLISESCQNLAQGFVWQQNLDSALFYASLATEYASRSNSNVTLAISFHKQGLILSHFNRFQDGVIKELEFLQLSEEIGNDFLKSTAYAEIGFISMEAGNYNEASIYFKRALQLADDKFDEFVKARIYLGIAQNSFYQENFVQAENYLSRARKTFKKLKSYENIGMSAFISGRINSALGKTKNALADYEFALKEFETINNTFKVIEVQHYLGLHYLQQKKYLQAENFLMSSINSSLLFKNKMPYCAQSYRSMSEVYEATNRIKQAFQFQKLYLDYISNQSINKDAVQIGQLTESNLREERERLIEKQKASIDKERKEKEILEVQRTKNLLITLVFAIFLVLGIIILFLRMKQIRSKQEQREAEMSQTLLRTQMNPHFVFNAMSVIQSYIFTHNPERSSKFLVNFSKLMRLILENSPKEFIPLELEAEILEKYLNTQKMRFEDRFEFEIQFEDDLLFKKALVPPMITQPFVENAIEHGQLHTIEGGKISVFAVEDNGMLKIIVQDNGIGRKNSRSTQKIKTHKSMAIDITRERIAIINRKYRSSGNLNIEDFDKQTGQGTMVTILLPLKFE
jgi:tetratricopeptide (TPR) repeat protein